jgi:Uma2 family endonuclease
MTTSPLVKGSKPSVAQDLHGKKRNPTIEDFHFPEGLPTADDLPCSDGAPVDSELQELIPGLLKAILIDIWANRKNWLFSIDMAFYYDPARPQTAISPDGMLSFGVADAASENLRSSFVLWQEKVIPLFAVEIVSKTPGKEKSKKYDIYQSVGILYYLIYSPLLKRKAKFQLYKLIEGEYVLQSDGRTPYWMPEVGLAIGAEPQAYGGIKREWLYWYDEDGVRYPTPIERADIEYQRAEAVSQQVENEIAARIAAEQKVSILMEQMRKLGIDPDSIDLQ